MATRDGPPFEPRISINRRLFSIARSRLTGQEIAEMIGVPADNAVVERKVDDELVTIHTAESIEIESGACFLVTRQFIMGGSGVVAHVEGRST